MRRLLLAVTTVLLLAVLAAPAAAHPTVALEPQVPTDLTFAATTNVEYLGRFPEHSGTAGGRLDAERELYFVTDPRVIAAYDVSDPAAPVQVGLLPMFQHSSGTGAALAQEDPDFGTVTLDGEERIVMVLDGSPTGGSSSFHVVDITDPAAMAVLGSFARTDHTWTCVTGTLGTCQYAYGRSGYIMDLTDPTAPAELDNSWREITNGGNGFGDAKGNSTAFYTHDLTEIRPGLVMSAGTTSFLLDTTDPASPVELTKIDEQLRFTGDYGFHSVEWANGGTDPYVVLGTEIAPDSNIPLNATGSDCENSEIEQNSVIQTYDASAVADAIQAYYEDGVDRETAFADVTPDAFRAVDTFDAGSRGIFLDGAAPSHVLYCAHWMELAPDFDGGGLMAVSYYDRGTRFVEIAGDGTMTEIGWLTAAEGYSGSVQWVSEDVLYISDYRRGLEIVRLDRDTPATGTYSFSNDLVAAASSAKAGHSPLERDELPALSSAAFGLLMIAAEVRRRRRTRG